MTYRRLAPGVPDGAIDQRQNGPRREYVLVSEWARRAAHELDMNRSEWVKAIDAFGGKDKSDLVFNPLGEINHAEWLSDYAAVEERYAQVNAQRQSLQTFLGVIRRTGKIRGVRYLKDEYVRRRDLYVRELDYLMLLQKKLRYSSEAVIKATKGKLHKEAQKQIGQLGHGDDLGSPVLSCLAILKHGIRQLVRDGLLQWSDIPDDLMQAMNTADALIRAEVTANTLAVLEKDDYVLIDGILARRQESTGGWD